MKSPRFTSALEVPGLFSLCLLFGFIDPAYSQPSNIVPDDTLGDESSQVIENVNGLPIEAIIGGAQREQNLFHSFQEFNVSEGREAYFISPNLEIQNIFSRVTGNNISEIMGVLGTLGESEPNLFLINPNGIIFGENSRLDVGGSFAATTANGIRFVDNSEFSATNLQSSLLTISVPLGLQFGSNPGNIINRSIAENSNGETNVTGEATGLQVPVGRTLAIVGGNVLLDSGNLTAKGGHIEIGSVQEGNVAISETQMGFVLNYDAITSFGDITLDNTAVVDTTSSSEGSINLNARDISILGESSINTGIASSLGSPEAQVGDIQINATGSLVILNSVIRNTIEPEGVGNSGNIIVNATNIEVIENQRFDDFFSTGILTGIREGGVGQAGNLTIQSDNISVSGDRGRVASVNRGKGNSGNVTIATRNLLLANGGQISSASFGNGNSGDFLLHASETIEVQGEGNRFPSGLFAQVSSVPGGENFIGEGGNLTIETESLTISDGGTISVSTSGLGNAGDIIIRATSISIVDNPTIDNFFVTGIGASTSTVQLPTPSDPLVIQGSGNGGDITIETEQLNLQNEAQIATIATGEGNAGNLFIKATKINLSGGGAALASQVNEEEATGQGGSLIIETDQLNIRDRATITVATFGKGNAGNLSIKVSDFVEVIGSQLEGSNSSIRASVFSSQQAQGGNLIIDTDKLIVKKGGQISSSVFGSGTAGLVNISANEILLDGEAPNGFNSGIFSSIEPSASGSAGEISINANNLTITNGAEIDTTILGNGNGGNINIDVSDTITLDGRDKILDGNGFRSNSGIFATAENNAIGNAGNLKIAARNLRVRNGAEINNNSAGQGNAGSITLKIKDSIDITNGSIAAAGNQASGGKLNIAAANIILRDNSDISTNVNNGKDNGGNITLTADSVIAFDDSDIFAFAQDGQGGNITLDTPAYFGENFTLNSLTESDTDILENNSRADINATGAVSGEVSVPDVSFIQNSLTELQNNAIDTDELVANSCVVRSQQNNGSFIISGSDSLPFRPGNNEMSEYPTGEVRSVADKNNSSWQPGDLIIEPQGAYRLTNGKLVLSRECQNRK